MANGRMLKFSFFRNEELAEVSMAARLLFQGLWFLADREGRLEDRTRRIRADIFPYDDVDIEAELHALVQHDFIRRYCVDGKGYIWIVKFLKHQNINAHEPASTLPPPPDSDASIDMHMQADACIDMHRLNKIKLRDIDVKEKENACIDMQGAAAQHDDGAVIATDASAPSRPLSRPRKKTQTESSPPAPRPHNPLWDALEESLEYHPKLPGERTNMGKVARDLEAAGATPEEVSVRTARYIRRYGRERLTLNALYHHWSELEIDVPTTTTTTISNGHNNNNGGLPDAEAVHLATQEREARQDAREAERRRLYDEKVRLYDDQTAVGG